MAHKPCEQDRLKVVQFDHASHNARERRHYLQIARIGMMHFTIYAILFNLRLKRVLHCISVTAKNDWSMISCYLLHLKAVLTQPSGDLR